MTAIDVLIRKAKQAVTDLKVAYERSLTDKSISDDLLYDVRQVVQDCQSALDMTATALDRKYGKGGDRSPYFPLHKAPAQFAKAMKDHFSGVPQGVYDAMERHQPYQPGKTELGYLHKLAKVNKHQDFTPQTRDETRWVEVKGAGGSIGFQPYQPGKGGVSFGGQVFMNGVEVDPVTLQPLGGGRKPYIETIFVSIAFVDPPVLVVPTLEALVAETAEAVNDIHREAGL